MNSLGPASDADIPAYLRSLGLPGLADIHVHFLPEPMMRKVWAYFDEAQEHYGRAWPIHYRTNEQARLETLRSFGVRAVPALSYAHKPGMAAWLNGWSQDFAGRVPDAVHCATFYPEPGAGDQVRQQIQRGARLFKVHISVGGFSPDDPQLDDAWHHLEVAGVPVVIHAGSAPGSGEYTGPEPVRRLLERFPQLLLVIAHQGMPEYHAFADLVEKYPRVHLDTTMVGTDFTNQFAPMPESYLERLPGLRERIVLGSDFPNIPYRYSHQLEALARLGMGDEWMRSVLWDNGARLLRLPAHEAMLET